MQRSESKVIAATAVAVIVVVLAIAVVVMYSGAIDVAAAKPESELTEWVLETTREHSVERRADGITPPAEYRYTQKTAEHFGEMCGLCHGAPGKDPSPIGKGLSPEPPDLAKIADHLSEKEVFWVAKNGIRMTGMPSFGKTHSDQELWEMVALVKRLPEMSPEEYRKAGGK